jgi:hypothetical protein
MLQPLHVFLVAKIVNHNFWPSLMEMVEIEQGRKTKEQLPLAPPPKKTKAHCECMLSLPIGCIKILIPKLLVTIFGLG